MKLSSLPSFIGFFLNSSTVQVICLEACSNFRFPLVSIVQQLLLVVQKFFMGLCGKLEIGTLHNCINWASLLENKRQKIKTNQVVCAAY